MADNEDKDLFPTHKYSARLTPMAKEYRSSVDLYIEVKGMTVRDALLQVTQVMELLNIGQSWLIVECERSSNPQGGIYD